MLAAARVLAATVAFALAAPAAAFPWVAFEVATGLPVNLPSPLTIQQNGYPTIHLTARYHTDPFTSPVYYRLRFRIGLGRRGDLGLEWIHDKLYLSNPPPEVGNFSISHGYNLAVLSRGFDLGPVWLRAGAGAVIAHPESTVRGRELSQTGGPLGGGYHLSGFTFAFSVEKDLPLLAGFYIPVALMFTVGDAWVPVAGGTAEVPSFAFHFVFGLGR